MKKFKLLLVAFFVAILAVPFAVRAEESTIERPKITVYMFRGETCPVCANALAFFDSIEEEYGKYYELVTYEVWNDKENSQLLDDVAEYLDTKITGVPFIMIGDKTYPGFLDSWGEEIKAQIVAEYNKSDEERTDLLENMKNGVKLENSAKDRENLIISVISIVVIALIVTFLILARRGNGEKKNVTESKKEDFTSEEEDSVKIEEDEEKVVKNAKNTKNAKTKTNKKNTTGTRTKTKKKNSKAE